MNKNELIADRIEEVIGQVFASFRSMDMDSGPTEYSLFYNPGKSAMWFILLFFKDSNQLKNNIKDGTCYRIFSFVQDALEKTPETSKMSRSIHFEAGNRPIAQTEIDHLYDKLLAKDNSALESSGKTDLKTCTHCGHDFDSHQLLVENADEVINSATQGWMMCPEENCHCFSTWSFNANPEQA